MILKERLCDQKESSAKFTRLFWLLRVNVETTEQDEDSGPKLLKLVVQVYCRLLCKRISIFTESDFG